MRRHILRPLILALAAALLVAVGPVAAKVPYFSVEVSPPNPSDGDVVVVTVQMWDDADHTQPATWWPEPTIAGLLEFRGSAGSVPVTVHRLEGATYVAEVTLAAGSWRLVAFPIGVARSTVPSEGYPTPVDLTVSERWDPSAGAVLIAAGTLGIFALLLAARARRWMLRYRRPTSATG